MSNEPAPPGSESTENRTAGSPETADANKDKTGNSTASVGALPWLKEAVTSVLALAIAAVTLLLLVLTFEGAKKSGTAAVAAFTRQKDVLQFVLPILGTVLGYYFGRVPAERRAEAAEQSASGSQKQAAALQQSAAKADTERTAAELQTEQTRTDTKDTMGRVREALTGAAPPVLGGPPTAAQPNVERALAEINALDARMSQ